MDKNDETKLWSEHFRPEELQNGFHKTYGWCYLNEIPIKYVRRLKDE